MNFLVCRLSIVLRKSTLILFIFLLEMMEGDLGVSRCSSDCNDDSDRAWLARFAAGCPICSRILSIVCLLSDIRWRRATESRIGFARTFTLGSSGREKSEPIVVSIEVHVATNGKLCLCCNSHEFDSLHMLKKLQANYSSSRIHSIRGNIYLIFECTWLIIRGKQLTRSFFELPVQIIKTLEHDKQLRGSQD